MLHHEVERADHQDVALSSGGCRATHDRCRPVHDIRPSARDVEGCRGFACREGAALVSARLLADVAVFLQHLGGDVQELLHQLLDLGVHAEAEHVLEYTAQVEEVSGRVQRRVVDAVDARHRVFCGSMCDVLEDRDDVRSCREALWGLVDQTTWLDWLLLTKRPQNFSRFLPPLWLVDPRPNVWLMTTVESADYTWRIAEILKVPAVVHGVSYEPALGAVDWEGWLGDPQPGEAALHRGVTWLISGTESGASARAADLQWFRDARDKCREAGAAFFMKQITEKGHKIPFERWPHDLRVRELPTPRPWRD